MTSAGLRLQARDADDLTVFASLLQDAIVPLSDVTYVPSEQRFVMVVNRFLWDADGAPDQHDQRVNCGVVFDRVTGVQSRGLDLADRGRMLDLLTIRFEEGRLFLVFSGGADIRLAIDGVEARLEDLGEPWPTGWRPGHEGLDDAEK